jgi:hypothetical protein
VRLTGTIDLVEVIWTLAALPGLLSWIINLVSARRSLRAVVKSDVDDGRLPVAKYAVRKSWVMIGLSFVFVLIGTISMLRPSNPELPVFDLLRAILTAGLLAAPAMISFIGADWRRVENEVLRIARERTIAAQRQALPLPWEIDPLATAPTQDPPE